MSDSNVTFDNRSLKISTALWGEAGLGDDPSTVRDSASVGNMGRTRRRT